MLSDRCLSVCPVLSVTFAHCGQTVGWIKMPLGKVVGLGPGHIVLHGDPAPHSMQPLPTFGPCLLWPNGRPPQQLLSSCTCMPARHCFGTGCRHVLMRQIAVVTCFIWERAVPPVMSVRAHPSSGEGVARSHHTTISSTNKKVTLLLSSTLAMRRSTSK